MKNLFKSRRGSIMIVLVFGSAMAIVCLGMLQVASTLYASGRSQENQYADIQTMRSICGVGCYEYVTDLMACYATRNIDADMPGTSDSVVYHESIKALQDELMESPGSLVWNVGDASVALAATGTVSPETQTQLLSLVMGRAHEFQLELEEEMTLDFDADDVYLGADESRIPLRPVLVKVTLKVKSETVTMHYSVEGLYLYVQREVIANADGTSYNRAAMRITDDGLGSGVRIYRA